jgi:hypothetical protein
LVKASGTRDNSVVADLFGGAERGVRLLEVTTGIEVATISIIATTTTDSSLWNGLTTVSLPNHLYWRCLKYSNHM